MFFFFAIVTRNVFTAAGRNTVQEESTTQSTVRSGVCVGIDAGCRWQRAVETNTPDGLLWMQ